MFALDEVGKVQESIAYLRKALEAGFKDRKLLMKDKEFAALRSPEFHQLMLQQTGGNNQLVRSRHAPRPNGTRGCFRGGSRGGSVRLKRL